jgi:AcrR family transcriptional regulator
MTTTGPTSVASAAVGGRRHRMSLDEVERAVLDTARDLLIGQQGGLTVSLDHINLEVIISAAGVPRSSAFRRWPTKEDFVLDFLCDLAGPNWAGTAAFDEETLRTAIQVAQQNIDLLTGSVDDRRRLIDEIVRIAARQNYEAIITSPEWRTYVALTATLASMSDETARDRVRSRLYESETTFIKRMTTFYAAMGDFLGFRLKEPYTYDHLTAAGAAIVEGLALRHTLGIELVDQPIPITEGGETRQWVLAAAGFKAVLDAMIDLDPDFKAPPKAELATIAAASVDDLMALMGLALDDGSE